MRKLFIDWYEENYSRTNVNKDKFDDFLKAAYGIEEQNIHIAVSIKGEKKKQRTFGEQFSDVVVESILEDSPHFFAIHSK